MKNKPSSDGPLRNIPKRDADSTSDIPEKSPGFSRTKVFILCSLVLAAGLALGALLSSKYFRNAVADSDVWNNKGVVELKPGPWGRAGYSPMTIEAPSELLNPRAIEATPVKWVFQGYSPASLEKFLEDAGMSRGEAEKLMNPGSMIVYTNGVSLSPTRNAVLNLEPRTLEAIYRVLAKSPENQSSSWVVWQTDFDAYPKLGVSNESILSFKKMSVHSGNFWVCYSMPFVFQGISNYEDKVALHRALSEQRTMLLRLFIPPQSDVQRLTNYWGKAFWKGNVYALLDAQRKNPEGGVLDVIELLPPFPTALLYNYAMPQNGLNGPLVQQNCSWTAFNFFRDVPDTNFANPAYVMEKLKADYFPIQSDPQFGDVIMFLNPGGTLIHIATYLADDICYSKNGSNTLHPWVLSKISELKESFSFGLEPGENLSVLYFRNKYY